MKIYLGSRFDRHQEMENYANVLRGWGHEITSGWHSLDAETKMRNGDPEVAFNRAIAEQDHLGIFQADLFVGFTESPLNPPPGSARGGRHVELGLAMGWDKLLMAVGPRENVFHYMVEIHHFLTAEEWLSYMASLPHPNQIDTLHLSIRATSTGRFSSDNPNVAARPRSLEHEENPVTVVDTDPEIFRAKGFSRP